MVPVPRAAAKNGLSYRPLADADFPFIESVYVSMRASEVAATGWPPHTQLQFLRDQFRLQHEHYQQSYSNPEWLIIERDNKPIGRLYLDETADRLHVIDIAIVQTEQSRGFGTAILTDLLADARAKSKYVSAFVEKNNPALSLYHRLGFEWAEDHGFYQYMRSTARSVS